MKEVTSKEILGVLANSDQEIHVMSITPVCRYLEVEGKFGVKLRLDVRGDQEVMEDMLTNLPFINKVYVGLFFFVAVSIGWNLKTRDKISAFLQLAPLNRDFYGKPSK